MPVWVAPEGVEHLLRDVKDATISTLATDVSAKLLVGMLHTCTSNGTVVAAQGVEAPQDWPTLSMPTALVMVTSHSELHL